MLLQKNTARTLVDTNVLLRYILNDNPEMNQKANEIMDGNVFTVPEVLAEVAYVMTKVYKAIREDTATYLAAIVEDVDIEHPLAVKEAIKIYADNNLDFVDCMLIAYNHIDGTTVFTFDKKMNKLLKNP